MANHSVCVEDGALNQSLAGSWPQITGSVQATTIPFSAGIDLNHLRKIMDEAHREAEDKAYQAVAEARAIDLQQAEKIIAAVPTMVQKAASMGQGAVVVTALDNNMFAPADEPAPLTPGQKKVFQYLSAAGLAPDITKQMRSAITYKGEALVESTRPVWVITARWR